MKYNFNSKGSERRAALARNEHRVVMANTTTVRLHEAQLLDRYNQEALAQHGPVRVFMQGGKKCNETR